MKVLVLFKTTTPTQHRASDSGRCGVDAWTELSRQNSLIIFEPSAESRFSYVHKSSKHGAFRISWVIGKISGNFGTEFKKERISVTIKTAMLTSLVKLIWLASRQVV